MADGSYGRYVPGFGIVPIIAAVISALPALLQSHPEQESPQQIQQPLFPAQPQTSPAVWVGAGLGGLLIVGAFAYLFLKKR